MARITGHTRRDLIAGLRCQPCAPTWPPTALIEGGRSHPVIGIARDRACVGVMAVFALGRRVDDARDMARLRDDEGFVGGPHLLETVKAAAPMRDVVGLARDGADGDAHPSG